jgi:putative pre-16S rRNA nuclease
VSRVLAVDWGTRRVGLAVSDPSGRVARPLETLVVRSAGDAASRVGETAAREGVGCIVVGLPLHPSGDEGSAARGARRLGEALRGQGYRVEFVDERWTSEEARELAVAKGERRGEKGRLDQLVALLLLQQYLDRVEPEDGHA